MSFRKRNVGLSGSSIPSLGTVSSRNLVSGVRASPLDGRTTTSTGTQSLDDLLAGHAGLPLGHSLLIEETGTTDFASALCRCYAAEGLVQGQQVHVIGMPEQWGRDLPGLIEASDKKKHKLETSRATSEERMKIAWRYERLGEHGATSRAPPAPVRSPTLSSDDSQSTSEKPFCHTFDLTKRLVLNQSTPLQYHTLQAISCSTTPPLNAIVTDIADSIQSRPHKTTHRVLVPSLLSPAFYPQDLCNPTSLLPFFHSLRSLLRRFPQEVTAMITLPLSLYPRSTGLIRWVEVLCDGVLELAPFPYSVDIEPPPTGSSTTASANSKSKAEERPQGMLKVHKLPVLTEKGGGSGAGDDTAFSLGRRKFTIVKYHLPPLEGDQEAQRENVEGGGLSAKGIDF